MAKSSLSVVLRHLRKLIAAPPEDEHGDGALLQRFVVERDETAFATLLRRYGPLVLGVCRQVLKDDHAADDVFQATFLVLARKAGAIRNGQSLPAWLHRVASNLARTARTGAERRRLHEQQAMAMAPCNPADEDDRQTWRPLLHDEVDRLPEKYRVPVVLCYLHGKTHEEAALELNWPLGTVKGRLGRAREVLRRRLARRGLTLSAAGLAAFLGDSAASAAVPSTLEAVTLQTALAFAAGSWTSEVLSTRVAALAEGMIATMKMKITLAATLLLAVGLLGTGAGLLALHGMAEPPAAADPFAKPAPPARPKVADVAQPRGDEHGEPLPPGAVARLGTTSFRHPGRIGLLAYAPDGKTLATSDYGTARVRLWDVATGREINSLGEGAPARAAIGLVFSPDGKTLAASTLGSGEGAQAAVTLWDVTTGKKRHAFDKMWAPAFSPDGKLIAARTTDPLGVTMRDAATGAERHRFEGEGFDGPLAFTHSGKAVVVGGLTAFQFIDVASGLKLRTLAYPANAEGEGQAPRALTYLTFSPDDKLLIAAGHDRRICLWEVATGKPRQTIACPDEDFPRLALSPDGRFLAISGILDTRVRLWDLRSGELERSIRFDTGRPRVNAQVPAADHNPSFGPEFEVPPLAFAPDSKTLATAGYGRSVRFWNVATGQEASPFTGHQAAITTLAFTPDAQSLVTGSLDQTVRQWNVATGKEVRVIQNRQGLVDGLAFAQAGEWLAVGGDTNLIRLWSMATGRQLRQFVTDARPGPPLGVPPGFPGASSPTDEPHLSYAMSPDDKWLATVHLEFRLEGDVAPLVGGTPKRKMATLWDLATGKSVRKFTVSEVMSPVSFSEPIAFSPDSGTLAVPDGEKIGLWDITTGQQLRQFQGEAQRTTSLVFSPSGHVLAAASTNKAQADVGGFGAPEQPDGSGVEHVVTLWEVATGKELRQLEGHRERVHSVAFTTDGKTLATGSQDGSCHLWDAGNGKRLCRLVGHQGGVRSVAFSPDGKYLATGGDDATALLWPAADLRRDGQPVVLGAAALQTMWQQLGDGDPARAAVALRSLAATPKQTLPLLQQHMRPVPAPGVTKERIDQLTADLDSKDFDVRQKAEEELGKLGEWAELAVRTALAGKPTLDATQRLERVLQRVDEQRLSADSLRNMRAIELLEQIGTAEAVQVLQGLAKGAPEARLTREAEASLQRMGRR